MNLIDAIKSGKRFRRKGWDDYIFIDDDYFLKIPGSLKKEFLLADDWEVEERSVTITSSQFEAAVHQANQSFSIYNPPHICEYLSQLKKELGL